MRHAQPGVRAAAPPAPSTGAPAVAGRRYLVSRLGELHPATVLDQRVHKGARQVYISFAGQDKRLDSWVDEAELGEAVDGAGAAEVAGSAPESSATARARAARDAASSPEREHAALTRVRNFEDVRFGEYLIKTWYFSPYPAAVEEPVGPAKKRKLGDDGPGAEGSRGRLWVCDLCFKYMRHRASWETHTLRPPGRKVYQRGSYSMFEVDGAAATNLSLFGKLFIDHKSLFFHVENFLFYVLCDASTSRRDQVLAFFSKVSYDDYNLACIVTFPPFQNRGFGKLLIEFSYYLTRHPSTRSPTGSPGTPERPLSDLGLKGYTAFWAAVMLRTCRRLLADAPTEAAAPATPAARDGRALRSLRRPELAAPERIDVDGVAMGRLPLAAKGQYAVSTTLADLARACHIRTDDAAQTLAELGFLRHRRRRPRAAAPRAAAAEGDGGAGHADDGLAEDEERGGDGAAADDVEWRDVQVVVSRQAVDDAWAAWRVKDAPLLDDKYVLL